MTLRSGGNINQMINAWDPEVGMTGTTIKNFIEGRLIAARTADSTIRDLAYRRNAL